MFVPKVVTELILECIIRYLPARAECIPHTLHLWQFSCFESFTPSTCTAPVLFICTAKNPGERCLHSAGSRLLLQLNVMLKVLNSNHTALEGPLTLVLTRLLVAAVAAVKVLLLLLLLLLLLSMHSGPRNSQMLLKVGIITLHGCVSFCKSHL